jgi:hypothetical protein
MANQKVIGKAILPPVPQLRLGSAQSIQLNASPPINVTFPRFRVHHLGSTAALRYGKQKNSLGKLNLGRKADIQNGESLFEDDECNA